MWSLLLTLAATAVAASPPSLEPSRRALGVAYNGERGGALTPLRYADDDGLLWLEVLERLGYVTSLLTTLDEDTASLGGPARPPIRAPTPDVLKGEVRRIRAENDANRARGIPTETVFVYVGHGAIDAQGRAYLTLAGGELPQRDFYSGVV